MTYGNCAAIAIAIPTLLVFLATVAGAWYGARRYLRAVDR